MAITWRNINVDLPDPVRLLGNAQQAVANMQRALNEELDRNQELTKHNLEARTNYLKGQLQNYVAGLQTEEDIKRARESGVFNQLVNAIPVADRSPHVNALDHRLNELRQQEKSAIEHEQSMRALREASVRDAILSDIFSGDPKRMAAAERALTDGSYWQEAPVWRELFNMRGQLADRKAAAERQSREADEYRQRREAEQLQMSLARAFDQARTRQLAQVQALAKQFGIPLDQAGLPVRTEQNSAQFEAFTQALTEAGLNGVNDTGYREQLVKGLVERGIAPGSLAGQAALKGLDLYIKANSELGAQDQTRLNRDLDQLEVDYTNARTEVEAQIREALKDNPFASVVGKEQPTVKELVEILTKSKDYDPLGINSFTTEDLPADVTKLLSNGIKVRGQQIPITPALLQQVLPGLVDDWDPEDDLADPLVKMFEENPELIKQYKAAYEAQAQLDKQLREIDANKLKAITQLYNQYFRNSGNSSLAVDQFVRTINKAAKRPQEKAQ